MRILVAIIAFLPLLSFGQSFEIQRADLNTSSNDFAPSFIGEDLVWCNDQRTRPAVAVKDLNEGFPVHWMMKKGEEIFTIGIVATPAFHHVGPMCSIPGTNEVIFSAARQQQDKSVGQVQLFIGKLEGNRVIDVVPFEWNDASNNGHPTISPDGKMLVFASDRAGAAGGSDLWVSFRDSENWKEPTPLTAFNSAGNEYYPSFAPNGWIYFATQRNGDDLDIYFSYPIGESWSAPQTVGEPMNSRHDDYGICFSADGLSGYFTSDRQGNDADLFTFNFVMPEFEDCKPSLPEPTCYLIEETAIQHADTLPVYYEWDYGDGSTARGLSNEHCFPGIGSYDVALNIYDTLTGAVFGRVSELTVQIEPARIPFILAPDTLMIGEDTAFAIDTTEIDGFNVEGFYWNSGDGRRQKGDSFTLSYPAPGVYDVQLGVLAPPQNGYYPKLCASKQIVVIDPAIPMVAMEERGAEPELPKARMAGENAQNEDHRVYFVEFHSSELQMTLDDPFFADVPFEITERFRKRDSLYHYSVGEQEQLIDLVEVRKAMIDSGYVESIVGDALPEVFEETIIKRGMYYTDEEKVEMNDYVKTLADIRFNTNSAVIRADSKANLDHVVEVLFEHPDLHIQVDAHTDNQGDAAYNMQLSIERAESVVDYLTRNGINKQRIHARGFGNLRPLADNSTEAGRSMNRRVAFRLIFPD